MTDELEISRPPTMPWSTWNGILNDEKPVKSFGNSKARLGGNTYDVELVELPTSEQVVV